MKNWRSILLLVLVFTAGAAAGAFGMRTSMRHATRQAMMHPERSQLVLERTLVRRLELDGHQEAQLHAILTDSRNQLETAYHGLQPQVNAILHSADGQIAALLKPDQLAHYQKFKLQNHPFWRPQGRPAPSPNGKRD